MAIEIEIIVKGGLTKAQLKYLHFLEANDVKDEPREYISQREAYKRFGEGNVKRWVDKCKVQRHKRPGTMEYNLNELRRAAATIQDYDY